MPRLPLISPRRAQRAKGRYCSLFTSVASKSGEKSSKWCAINRRAASLATSCHRSHRASDVVGPRAASERGGSKRPWSACAASAASAWAASAEASRRAQRESLLRRPLQPQQSGLCNLALPIWKRASANARSASGRGRGRICFGGARVRHRCDSASATRSRAKRSKVGAWLRDEGSRAEPARTRAGQRPRQDRGGWASWSSDSRPLISAHCAANNRPRRGRTGLLCNSKNVEREREKDGDAGGWPWPHFQRMACPSRRWTQAQARKVAAFEPFRFAARESMPQSNFRR